jgi:very-short-patch-repair endonuclease
LSKWGDKLAGKRPGPPIPPAQLQIGDLLTNQRLAESFEKQQKKRKRREKTSPEDLFDFQCKASRLPPYTRQAQFAAKQMGRKWAADFCWAQYSLLVEIDGLVPHNMGKGRHQTIEGQQEDMRKGNAAVELGYFVLHFSQNMVKSGEAIELTKRVLALEGWKP